MENKFLEKQLERVNYIKFLLLDCIEELDDIKESIEDELQAR